MNQTVPSFVRARPLFEWLVQLLTALRVAYAAGREDVEGPCSGAWRCSGGQLLTCVLHGLDRTAPNLEEQTSCLLRVA
jgi:hypothetical protein